MILYLFATTLYAVSIFIDDTDNCQLTKSSNLQTNFCFMLRALSISNFILKLFKCNSLYSKIRQRRQNKVAKENKRRKIKERE